MLPRDRIPTVITHNFDPLRGPFRNICNLPEAEAQKILDEINASGKRRIRENYLRRRMRTETWLLAERKKKLGPPRMERPIYFFLGNMADGADASRPRSVVIPVTAFPADVLTFTYPDSMSSFPIGTREDRAIYRKPYHGQVFTLEEIRSVISEFGMPDERWKSEETMRFEKFVEVQVWDDRPLRRFLPYVGGG
jgi:hypothetical protein